jgi:hypothetical protein
VSEWLEILRARFQQWLAVKALSVAVHYAPEQVAKFAFLSLTTAGYKVTLNGLECGLRDPSPTPRHARL